MRKTILVTGATGGLGPSVVKRLAGEYHCVVLYRGQAGFDALREVADVSGLAADLSSEEEVDRAVASIAGLFGVVHLVGGFASGDEATTWSKMLTLNLTSAVTVFRAAVPRMAPGGRLIAVSSSASIDRPAGMPAYVVSKSALNTLVEVLSGGLRNLGITVNAILPDTLGTAAAGGAGSSRVVPLERVADSIAWLLSDRASSVTGALLPIRA